MLSQLRAFKKGWRGGPDESEHAQSMRNAIQYIPEKRLEELVDYIATLKTDKHPDRLFGNRYNGEHLYERNCAVCHGDNGEGDSVHHMARLDHQHGWYVRDQLQQYRQDQRGTHGDDDSGRTMNFYAKLLKSDEEVRDVAAWLSVIARKRAKEAERKTNRSTY